MIAIRARLIPKCRFVARIAVVLSETVGSAEFQLEMGLYHGFPEVSRFVGSLPGDSSPRRYYRQLNKARLIRRVIDALRRLLIIRGFGPEDIRHKLLRIAVVKREPARL